MSDLVYCGVALNEGTCKVPYSYIISKINDIVDQLKCESNVSRALKTGAEAFSLYGYNEFYIVTHTHNSQISFSKINDYGELLDILDEDILCLSEQNQLFGLSRNVNCYIGAYQRNEIEPNMLFQSDQLIKDIQSKDFSSSNLHQIKDVFLKNHGNQVMSNDQLKNSLSLRLRGQNGDLTDNLKKLVNKARAYEKMQVVQNTKRQGEAGRVVENSSFNSLKSALNVLHSVTQSLGDMENIKDDISHNR